jgi:hypothetical protein
MELMPIYYLLMGRVGFEATSPDIIIIETP